MAKYDKSFEVDQDDIPSKCPICGREFIPLNDFVDIDYYKDGYRSVLCCDSCNFKKVLGYDTQADVEAEMQAEEDDD